MGISYTTDFHFNVLSFWVRFRETMNLRSSPACHLLGVAGLLSPVFYL